MLQIFMLILITFMVVSSSSFWSFWVSMELYSFFLMPWLAEKENKAAKVNVFLYFMIQYVGSIVFLMASLAYPTKGFAFIMLSGLLMKMSCFPFHSWFVALLPFLSWKKVMVLITLSKLIPLGIVMSLTPPKTILWTIMAGLLFPVGGFNTSCPRSLIGYSSVSHSSWLVISVCVSNIVTVIYMIGYFCTLLPLCMYFMMQNLVSLKTTILNGGKAQLMLLILGLSGVPPFLGFIPKLLVLKLLVESGCLLEALVLGTLSILPLYFYFKMGSLSMGVQCYPKFSFCNPLSIILSLLAGAGLVFSALILLLSLSLL